MTAQELFRIWVGSSLCIDEYEWYKLSEVRRNNWENFANRLTEPDFTAIGVAFGVGPNAARDYFQGGDFDPEGAKKISFRIRNVNNQIEEYDNQAYVRRLLIACIKNGVPTDQLVAIERLANGAFT